MSLFNYSTLNVTLDKTTHSLIVEWARPEKEQKLNFEMLFELESVLAWAANKVEISSILFTSNSNVFCQGLDETNLGDNPDKIEKILARVRKIAESLVHLPQITVCDLKEGAAGVGLEFSLFCDIRIAHCNAQAQFNHLANGTTPSVGGVTLLSKLVGHSQARQWIYTGKKIAAETLEFSGLVAELYESENAHEVIARTLNQIDQGSAIARIQTKMAFAQFTMDAIELGLKIESKISKANMLSYDWKEAISARKEERNPEFMAAKSFTYTLNRAKMELTEELKP